MTIIGAGDIAAAIPAHLDRPDWTWFAAGVSNSQETRKAAFDREFERLYDAMGEHARFVYFSSLSIFYADTPYTRHKLAMEDFVSRNFEPYVIVRLGTITWGRNPRLLINHLRARHAAGLPLDVQPVDRYVLDLDEFQHHLGVIAAWQPRDAWLSCEYNITGRRMSVQAIVNEYVLQGEGVNYAGCH